MHWIGLPTNRFYDLLILMGVALAFPGVALAFTSQGAKALRDGSSESHNVKEGAQLLIFSPSNSSQGAEGKWHSPEVWAWYEYEMQQNMRAVDAARLSMAGHEGTELPIAQEAVRSWAASSSANADA